MAAMPPKLGAVRLGLERALYVGIWFERTTGSFNAPLELTAQI